MKLLQGFPWPRPLLPVAWFGPQDGELLSSMSTSQALGSPGSIPVSEEMGMGTRSLSSSCGLCGGGSRLWLPAESVGTSAEGLTSEPGLR